MGEDSEGEGMNLLESLRNILLKFFEIEVRGCPDGKLRRKKHPCTCAAKRMELDTSKCSKDFRYNLLTRKLKGAKA